MERAVAADARLWADWAAALRAIPENPFGVEVRTFGRTTAILAHAAPTSFFNRVIGMSSHDLDALGEVVAFYRERLTPCRIDVPPVKGTALLSGRLRAMGWRAVEQQANLIARVADLTLDRRGATPVEVREVPSEDAEHFAELYDRAYSSSTAPLLARFRRRSLAARIGRPGWHAYVAYLEGRLAGGGILHLADGVASLAGGATLPEFRRRGVQAALLIGRLLDARAAGCTWVVSRCASGSASQRNLERAGLKSAYTKWIWEASLQEGGSAPEGRRVITAA